MIRPLLRAEQSVAILFERRKKVRYDFSCFPKNCFRTCRRLWFPETPIWLRERELAELIATRHLRDYAKAPVRAAAPEVVLRELR